MLDIVILGSVEDLVAQSRNLAGLLKKYGLPEISRSVVGEIWEQKPGGNYSCQHMEIDVELKGVSTPLPVKRFLVEAMRLPHVFRDCPECSKRRSALRDLQVHSAA